MVRHPLVNCLGERGRLCEDSRVPLFFHVCGRLEDLLMELTNSKRLMYAASYVTTEFTPDEQQKMESQPGGGVVKANMLRALELTPQEVERVHAATITQKIRRASDDHEKLFAVAQRLARQPRQVSTVELAAALAPIPFPMLTQFMELSLTVKEPSAANKILLDLSERRRKISPIGRIHLERIEMYPAGVQKGELVFTVPMAPGETVSISHKEWSTSSREFEEIVQDFFESYSERGVAEKNDASMSSESEAKHSSAINFGASLSGSYAGVTLTTTLGITNTNDERESVKHAMQKTREVTEKASARTRKEHKVSVKLETKTGTEDRSAKVIKNTAATAVRIDYYRMMRKWRTGPVPLRAAPDLRHRDSASRCTAVGAASARCRAGANGPNAVRVHVDA